MIFAAHTKCYKIATVAIATALANLMPASRAWAMPAGPHDSFLGGPWEIVVKTRLDEEGLRFPLTVVDQGKAQKLDIVLPTRNQPVEIKLDDYVPDLKWQTNAVKQPGGGIAAKLIINQKNKKQDIWLNSGNPSRESISSSIGGVAIRKLHNPERADKLMKDLTHSRAVGILSIRLNGNDNPLEYVAKTSESIKIPGTKYKIAIREYLPHYSVDTETKKVANQSRKPVNPALKVAVNDGKKTTEHWLWAKFPTSPHKENKLPLSMRFTDFDLGGEKGKYILAAAGEKKRWLITSSKGRKKIESVAIGRPYSFANASYSFSIEEIIDGAIVKTVWANGSDRLIRPAVIATVKENNISNQITLELNKPIHHKIESGMLVMLYRRTQSPISKSLN